MSSILLEPNQQGIRAVATAVLLLWSPPSFRARCWVSVHQVRRLSRVGYPATCPTSSACGSARQHSDASIRV
ncbi:hypothetical protein V8C86DRAFT_2920166, partial [Haematococcus lacustris]